MKNSFPLRFVEDTMIYELRLFCYVKKVILEEWSCNDLYFATIFFFLRKQLLYSNALLLEHTKAFATKDKRVSNIYCLIFMNCWSKRFYIVSTSQSIIYLFLEVILIIIKIERF